MKHETISNIMVIKTNDKIWNDFDRNEIIDNALRNYLRERRKRSLDHDPSLPSRHECSDDSSSSSSESGGFTDSESDSDIES